MNRLSRRAFIAGSIAAAAGAHAGLLSIAGGRGVSIPVDTGHTAARSNGYDAAWRDGGAGWVQTAQDILANAADQTAGMVIHLSDSLSRETAFGAWAQNGAGKTAEDVAICEWLHADLGEAQAVTSDDGFKLAHPYFCSGRAYTVVDGAGPWDFNALSGMPRTTVQATARSHMDNCTYGGVDIVTLLAAIQKPQFCTLTFNFDSSGGDSSVSTISSDYVAICDRLEAAGIVPIIFEYTYRTVFTDPETANFNRWVDMYNAALVAFATSRGYPFVPLNTEMLYRIPVGGAQPNTTQMAAWLSRFLNSGDGVHYSTGIGPGGYGATADPYANGGDAATHTTGAALTYNGYGLKGWLLVQKMKQIKQLVVDA